MDTPIARLIQLQDLYMLIEKAERFAVMNGLVEEAANLDALMIDLHQKYMSECDHG